MMNFNQLLEILHNYKVQTSILSHALREAKYTFRDMVGEGINTWADFVAQAEIGLSVRDANTLCKLADFEDSIKVPLTDLNLSTAKFTALKGIPVTDDLVDDMKYLSLKDFKDRYYDVVSKIDNAPKTYKYMVMKRCNETGTLTKVYGEYAEQLESEIEKTLADNTE